MKQLHTPTTFEKFKAFVLLTLTATWTFLPSASLLGQQYNGLNVSDNGGATFQQDGSTTNITAPNQAIIEYLQFDIGLNEAVNFIQPNASSTVLNRVTVSDNPSDILGTMTSNGTVYLVNPAGIFFGNNAYVNTGALLAIAGNMTNDDYLNGLNNFSGLSGSVQNFGTIETTGMTALVGKTVANFGTIISSGNSVVMAAGEKVFLGEREGHVFVDLSSFSATDETRVENSGTIEANDTVMLAAGDALGLAILHSGLIEARSTRLKGEGSGDVEVTGTIEAIDFVEVTGETVLLKDEALISASDEFGGGEILIGGDQEGENPDVRNAENVFVGENVQLSADARISGQGGKLIVYADQTAIILGTLSARGAGGGDGGFVETSGKGYLVVAKAPEIGPGGKWLIDPRDIVIVNTTDTDEFTISDPGTDPTLFESIGSGNNARLDVDDITAALTSGVDVIVKASDGDLTLTADLDYDGANGRMLTFEATGDVVINGVISDVVAANESLNLNLTADSDGNNVGSVTIDSTVNLLTGTLTVDGEGFSFGNTGLLSAGQFDLSAVNTSSTIGLDNIGTLTTFVGNAISGDTLVGTSSAEIFAIDEANSGSVGGLNFTGVSSIDGAGGIDTFDIADAGSLSGSITGGGDGDILDYADKTGAVELNLSDSSATDITLGFTGIGELVGNGADTTVLGTASSDTFNISGTNSGTVEDDTATELLAFTGVTSLSGLESDDSFEIETGASLIGMIDGGEGNDTLDYTNNTDPITVSLSNNSATGITSNFSSVEVLIGNGSSTTLEGTANADTFNVSGANSGTVEDGTATVLLTFSGVANLSGLESNDIFEVEDAGSLDGTIAGGEGNDRLDYTNKTDTVEISLVDSSATDINNSGSAPGFSSIESFVGNGSGNGANNTTLTGTTDDDSFIIGSSDGSSIGVSSLNLVGNGTADDGDDTLIGTGLDDTFDLTASGTGSVSNTDGVDIGFSGISLIDAGTTSAGDTVETNAATMLTGNDNEATTNDITISNFEILASTEGTLNGTDGDDSFSIGALANTVYEIVFSGITQINAGLNTSGDTVITEYATTLTGIANEAETNGITISEFEILTSTEGTLTGSDSPDTFNLEGSETGTADGIDFSGITTINSSAGGDSYNVNESQTIDISLGTGGDTVTIADNKLLTGTITGNAGADRLIIGTAAQLIGQFSGGAGADTLEVTDGSQYVELTGSDITNGFSGEFTAVSNNAIVNVAGDDFTGVDALEFTGTGNTLQGLDQTSFWDVDAGQYSEGTAFTAIDPLNDPSAPTGEVLNFSGFEILQGNDSGDWFDISANAMAQLKGGAGDDAFNFAVDGLVLTSPFSDAAIDGEAGSNVLAGNLDLEFTQKSSNSQNETDFNRSEGIFLQGQTSSTDSDPGADEFVNIDLFKFEGFTQVLDSNNFFGDVYYVLIEDFINDEGMQEGRIIVYDRVETIDGIIRTITYEARNTFTTNELDTLNLTGLESFVEVVGDFGSTISLNADTSDDTLQIGNSDLVRFDLLNFGLADTVTTAINTSSDFFYFGGAGDDNVKFEATYTATDSGSFGVEAETIAMNSNSLTTDSGSISIDTGSSTFDQIGTISSTGGDIDINTGSFFQNNAISSTSGDIGIEATTFKQDANISTGGSVIVNTTSSYIGMYDGTTTIGSTIEYTAATEVYLSALQSTGAVSVVAESGGIYDYWNDEAVDITATDLTLTATNGIGTGTGDDLDTQINTLNITDSSGAISIQEADGLSILGIETTSGTIDILVDSGNLSVDGTVVTNSSSTVTLTASNGEVDIHANVSSASGGTVNITGDSVVQNENINTSGSVTVTANDGGSITADGTETDANSITYKADGSITLGKLTATGGNIIVTAGTGMLTVDDFITAISSGSITLVAENGAVLLNDYSGVDNYISSVDGNVNITGNSVTQNDDIRTSGTGSVAVTANTTNITMADGTTTSGSSIDYEALGLVSLGHLNAGAGAVNVTATNGSIEETTNNTDVNITAGTATLIAGAGIGSVNALDTSIGTLSATNTTSGDIVIIESDGLILGTVSNVNGNVVLTDTAGAITDDADGNAVDITANTVTLVAADGIGTTSNAIETTLGTLSATNNTAGDIVITETDGTILDIVSNVNGNVVLTDTAGAITDDTDGSAVDIIANTVTLVAAAGIGTTGNAIETTLGTLSATNNTGGDIVITETDGTILGTVSNVNGNVVLTDTAGAITDGNGSDANVVANTAVLIANQNIGSGDGTANDTNAAAIDITVTSIEAQAGKDVYLESSQAVAVGGASSSLAGLVGGADGSGEGVVKLKSAGTITVDEAVVADTDILLLTTAGDIDQNVNGLLTATTGNATLIAADNVSQNANITAGNDAYVEATGGSITMTTGTQTSADDIRYAAGTNVALDLLAATDSVSVVAGGTITDANSDETTNISGARARLVAGGSIGAAGGTANSDTNLNAVDISVANIEAQATNDIYLQSDQAVTVGDVGSVDTDYEHFASGETAMADSDLIGLLSSSRDVKLKSAGTITVAEAVQTGEDVLLLTTDGDIDQEVDVVAARDITFIADDNVSQGADIEADWIYVEAQGGDITMASGTQTGLDLVDDTVVIGNDIRYTASGNVALGLLSTVSTVSVKAGASIIDANSDSTTNVSGSRARLIAGTSIGSNAETGAIDISVSNVGALAGTNIYLNSNQAVTVGEANFTETYRQYFDGSVDEFVPGIDLTGIEGTAGDVQLESAGTITILEAVNAGTNLTLETINSGDITQDVAINTNANVNLVAFDNVYQNQNITTVGMIAVEAGSGEIVMADGTSTSGAGIDYSAGTDVYLSSLNGSDSPVIVTAGDEGVSGRIFDNLSEESENIIAGDLALSAFDGIGYGIDEETEGIVADDINISAETLFATNAVSNDIYINEVDDITLATVSNVNGGVYLAAGGSITDEGSDTIADVVADTAVLVAGGGIGSGSGGESDDNSDAVDITVNSIEAQAGLDMYLESSQAVAIGGVSGEITGLESTEGVVKLKSADTITVDEAIQAGADVLLLTTSGDINQNTGGSITASPANIENTANVSVIADGSVNQGASIDASNDVYVSAGVSITMADEVIEVNPAVLTQSTNGNIRYAATDDVALSRLIADSGNVSVVASNGSITDNATAYTNISANGARLQAGNSIGAAGGTVASNTNENALDISVDNIEAQAVNDIYLESDQAVIIGGVEGVVTNYERFASGNSEVADSNLIGFQSAAGSVRLKSTDAIALNEAVLADTDVLLITTGNGANLGINGTLTATNGNITARAFGISQSENINAGGDVLLESFSSIIMNSDVQTKASNIAYQTLGPSADIILGLLDAVDLVLLSPNGSIIDANADGTNISGMRALLMSENSIGSEADALNISVDTLEADAGGDIYLQSDQTVTLGGIESTSIIEESFAGIEFTLTDDYDLIGLESDNGVIKLKSLDTITVSESVSAGSDLLLLVDGNEIAEDMIDIQINASLSADNGNVSVIATNDIHQDVNISTLGGDVDVETTSGSIIMTEGTVTNSGGGNILYVANRDVVFSDSEGSKDVGSDITLGLLNASDGNISVAAAGHITEAADDGSDNIMAHSVRLNAGGSIGVGSNSTVTSPNADNNPGVPDIVTPSSGSLDVYLTEILTEGEGSERGELSSKSGGDTFIFGSGDSIKIDAFGNFVSAFTVNDTGNVISANRVNFDATTTTISDVVLDRPGSAGGDYTLASSGAIFLNNSLDPTVDGFDISSGGDQNYIFGLDSGEINNAIIEFLTDYALDAGGSIRMTSNRFETKRPDVFESTLLSPTTIISDGFNLTIEAAADFVMGQFEKLSIGSSADDILDPANSTSGNLNITADRVFAGDISVQGNFTLDTNTLFVVERLPETDIFGDDEEEGADIAVVGLLDFVKLSTIQGTAGGSIQEVIPIGGGDLGDITPRSLFNVQYGSLANVDELFSFGPDFDNISQPVTSLQFFPFVDIPQIFEIEPPVENVPEALREELLKLRIFARDLTETEEDERRDNGYVYITQMIVDELAPISAYEVAVNRISTDVAQRAIDFSKELLGNEGENIETISEVIGEAYREYTESNQDGTPETFAQYLLTPQTELAERAFNYVNNLAQLFEKIGNMGITETELSISRRNILSRLKVEGLRGRDMIDFFDSFMLANETGISLSLN